MFSKSSLDKKKTLSVQKQLRLFTQQQQKPRYIKNTYIAPSPSTAISKKGES